MSVIKKLASQTAVYGLSTIVGRFLNFLLVPLYTARLADVADYGVVNVIFSYAGFLAVIFTYGMETGFFFFARKHEKPESVFSTATVPLLISGLILLLTGSIFSDEIIAAAGYPGKGEYVLWFAAILAADAVSSLFFAWLRFNDKARNFAAIRLINIAINIGLNLFFILLCPWLIQNGYDGVKNIYNPQYLVQYIFISNLVASVAILPLFGKYWVLLKNGFDAALFKKILRYSSPMIIVGLAGMVNETLDRILLKQLLPSTGDYEAGMYGAFYKLSMIMTLFVQAFRFAAEPFFFKESVNENAQEKYAVVMKWFVYTCGAIFIFTMAALPWLAPLLIRNPMYFVDPRGLSVVPVLLLANLLLGIYYNLSTWYKVSGKTHIGAYIALAGAVITIGGNLYGIPKFGFVASAWTTLIAYAFMVLLGYILGQKHYPVPYNTLKIGIVLAVTLLLGTMAFEYSNISPVASYITLPAFIIFVWYLENRKNVAGKNQ